MENDRVQLKQHMTSIPGRTRSLYDNVSKQEWIVEKHQSGFGHK